MTELLQALVGIFGIVIACITLLFAYFQLRQLKSGQFAERRPYVVPSFEVQDEQARPARLYLVLTNHGNTPAKNVTVTFTNDADWNYLRTDQHFPFHKENEGISVIAPKTSMKYFLGGLDSKSPLQKLRNEWLTVQVEFGIYETHSRISDDFRLSLRDFAGSVKIPRPNRKQ